MIEHRFYPADEVPIVSTSEWHAPRARARHLEEEPHGGRLHQSLEFARLAAADGAASLVDLGAGDGGFLSLVAAHLPQLEAWGYEFTPANLEGALERGVTVHQANFLEQELEWGDIAVITEVLEHLDDPHGQVERIRWEGGRWLICSSPIGETPESHDEAHVWGWDMEAYAAMVTKAGWQVTHHTQVGIFQVLAATAA